MGGLGDGRWVNGRNGFIGGIYLFIYVEVKIMGSLLRVEVRLSAIDLNIYFSCLLQTR